jgi:hypothetical protein
VSGQYNGLCQRIVASQFVPLGKTRATNETGRDASRTIGQFGPGDPVSDKYQAHSRSQSTIQSGICFKKIKDPFVWNEPSDIQNESLGKPKLSTKFPRLLFDTLSFSCEKIIVDRIGSSEDILLKSAESPQVFG